MGMLLHVERMNAWIQSRFRSLNSDRSIIRKVIRGLLSALSSVAEQTSTERGPPLVRHSAATEARRERAKLGETKSAKVYDISFEGASFPKVIFSPSQRRRQRRVIACEFQLQKTGPSLQAERQFLPVMIVRFIAIIILHRYLTRAPSDARCIYVYNCAQYVFYR